MREHEIFDRKVAAEASDWRVLFASGEATRGDRRQFRAWLAAAPEHTREWRRIGALWQGLADFGDELSAHFDLVDPAPGADGDDTNIVQLPPRRPDAAPAQSPPALLRRRPWRRFVVGAATMAAVLLLMIFAFSEYVNPRPGTRYETGVGEQRAFSLADGSVVYLNTSTRLAVDMKETERAITLSEGEALFEVAPDAKRPFVVAVNGGTIRAVGTRFNVYLRDENAIVSVLEGVVQVRPNISSDGGQEAATASIKVAEQAVFDDTGFVDVRARVDLAPVTAWRNRKLIFHSTPLEDIVSQFNRYNRGKVVIVGAALARTEISGVFAADDVVSLIHSLKELVSVKAVGVAPLVTILYPAESADGVNPTGARGPSG